MTTATRKPSGSKSDDHETRFLNEGIDFKAKVRTCVEILALPFCRLGFGCFVKVVGDAVVPVARGEKMCYDTLRSLKAKLKTSGKHKTKVVINLAMNGIKVKDEKSQEVLKTFHIKRISFITHDPGDSKVFALIDEEGGGYTLHAFKSEKGANAVTTAIKQLFQLVYKNCRELKRKESETSMKQLEENGAAPTSPDPKHVDMMTGENLFSDLATVRSQMKANKTAEDWYQVPKQVTSETTKEDVYQVPSNVPLAQADKTDGVSKAAVVQDWCNLTADLDQIAKDLAVSDGPPMFPPSDVFGSDPFDSTATIDPFTLPTHSLSKSDPFSPIKENVPPPQINSPSQSNDFPSSDLFTTSQVTPGRGFDPFQMETPSVTADPFSLAGEQGSQLAMAIPPPPSKPSVSTSAFDDAFGESFAPSQKQTTRQLQSPPVLSPVSAVPFAAQTGSPDPKHPTQQKDPFAVEPLFSKSNVNSFGSFSFGNSQKQEASIDDRFAALRLLDDDTTGSLFPTTSDTNKAMSQFGDPFDAFESPASSTLSPSHQFPLSSNTAVTSTAFSAVSDPVAALSNAQVLPTAEKQISSDPFTPTGFLSSFNQSNLFEDGNNPSSSDKFSDQRTKEPFTGFNQSTMTPGKEIVNPKSLFATTSTFGTQKDPFESQEISTSTTVSSDPFALLSPVSAQANHHTSGGSAFGTHTVLPSATATSQAFVDPYGQSLGGDLFSTVPSISTHVTSMQGVGWLENSSDPFSSFGGAPQGKSAVSHAAFNDPFSSDSSSMGQMSTSLRLSKSAGSLAIKGVPSSTNPFLAGDTTPITASHPNPFADHLSVQSSLLQEQQDRLLQEQQKQMAANPFMGYANQAMFDST